MPNTVIPLSKVMISRFRDSFHAAPTGYWNLEAVLAWIRDGMYAYEINGLRHVLARDGKAAYDRLKAQLPAFTFGGTFYPTRGIAYLRQHSGLVVGDLDHLPDVTAAKRAICADPRTAFAFISPSGWGEKVGVRVPVVEDDATYKHVWKTVAAEYERLYGMRWDPSGKDISRLCFASFDPALYWNPDAAVFDVPPAPTPEPRPLALPRPAPPRYDRDRHDYGAQAVRTAVQMIESAELGTRHHARLKAARLLGGYVAADLLSEDQAYGALAQALVGHTEDLKRALKTVEDGLAYGRAHPFTLEALEAERRAWLTPQGYRDRHTSPSIVAPSALKSTNKGTPFRTAPAHTSPRIRTVSAEEAAAWRR
jgi:hypothetical protein